MLVAAYFVLFVCILLFAWVVDVRYNHSRTAFRATQEEHASLALVYAVRAHSYFDQSQHQRKAALNLRRQQPQKPSQAATQDANHCNFLSSHYEQRAARMQSLGQHHHKMSLVPNLKQPEKIEPRPSFSPKNNPAKLALVPRERSIPA